MPRKKADIEQARGSGKDAAPDAAAERDREAAKDEDYVMLEVSGRELRLSKPEKVFFPGPGHTKLDLARYYIECEQAVVRHLSERPTVLKRWVDGVEGKPFFQKRVPGGAPEWLQTATVTFPSGRHARELVPNDAAHLVWGANLGVVDWNPWPVRRSDLDHPDELRIDLDPGPGIDFAQVRRVTLAVGEALDEHGLRGFPKTSGSRGMHVFVRVLPEHGFPEVRRAALALAREVERRMPGEATSRWWKEEREGVFIDYNQNARDRTVASAYSVRAVPDARVSCPLQWDEVADVEPAELRIDTVPTRLRERGDPSATIDEHAGSLASLLELAVRDEREGLGDAPWPPHFRKQTGEPRRVQPSRAKQQ
ncbi:MAG TPA: DNA polymerase domain-containing protein [Solirubrobacteraceae bacterium]|nr:DNA polymerase domain-containing protein [Solirubrobacteraceae bacterium]